MILVAEQRPVGSIEVVRDGREWRLLRVQLVPENCSEPGSGTEIVLRPRRP